MSKKIITNVYLGNHSLKTSFTNNVPLPVPKIFHNICLTTKHIFKLDIYKHGFYYYLTVQILLQI